MPGELVQRVVEACVSWPEGRVGELKGVVQLLGGGMMKTRGTCGGPGDHGLLLDICITYESVVSHVNESCHI